ncbi:sulfatase-like hydrolase/transferase [Citrobacter farmeri]|uniref:sulfatase-like hydrolase/transferase n=1 Tax=Citrobacter farmeri TaxID=67824 RepID=UPI001905D2C9|nr:sulfatase-like hydrolase/transferase [Citrobacter farmeri]MBJ9164589.1 sulfatase-like hydrolase/transferase [Citrobacter farmeri]
MNKFIKTSIAIAITGLCQPAFSAIQQNVEANPNVIIILADDLALPDISAYGRDLVKTPNIDRLAQEGTLFTNGYVAASVCAVSRAALMTGKSPQKFGFTYNIDEKKDSDKGLQLTEKTLAERLKMNDYNTYAIGKWHLGTADKYYPTNRGFDDFYGFLIGETLYSSKDTPGIVTTHTKFDSKKRLSFDKREGNSVIVKGKNRELADNDAGYLTDTFTEKAVNYIKDQSKEKQPFFMYLAYNAPHWPLQVPEKYYNKFPEIKDPVRRTYVSMITNLDDNIGRVLDELAKTGQDKNTIVVFLSDNGCPSQFGFCDCSDPLGSGKFTYVQGGINVPYIIKWPGKIPEKYVTDLPVTSLDIVPTILKGQRYKPRKDEFDGLDLRDMLQHEDKYKNRKLYFGQAPVYSMIEGSWKLWLSEDQNKSELFDLTKDRSELNDISDEFPEKKSEMLKDLTAWKATLKKPDWPMHFSKKDWKTCDKETESIY